MRTIWQEEEKIAHIHGWDFSHIEGRYSEQTDFPWDYRTVIAQYLKPEMKLLDIDTGGGEFLLSLNHPHENTAATENYPPNVDLCKEVLLPLGIDFRQGSGNGPLPFEENHFDMVIDRHGDFNAEEIYRVLKPGGYFITQQVGAENDRELVELLCGRTPLPFPEQYLNIAVDKFRKAGFRILRDEECFRPIRFFDVGALVWFARIIQWEFPDFSVDTHYENLLKAQKILEEKGSIEGSTHRFLLVAQKEENILNEAMERIRRMEELFDRLQSAFPAEKDKNWFQESLQKLIQYYESKLWRQDFELDEQGLLPVGLKRGILSEDGIYNFLSDVQEEME